MGLDEDAREYHRRDPPGKLAVRSTKPTGTQRELSLSYLPGVAAPARDVAADPTRSYEYTARGNLVAVVSDGSAVLGLGDIGPLASKPVMEGKGVLFKRFADIDVFDLELDARSLDSFVDRVAAMEPTFGGVNLEDIAAPACFEAEERLRERMDVPVFHDDQHGTAIITGAALLNAVDLLEKELSELSVTFAGAGAAATATAAFYASLGVPSEQITMCDVDGVITTERAAAGDPHEHVSEFASDADAVGGTELADAMAGADVFVGLSAGGIVSPEMVRSMAPNPVVFAMANPEPEIDYDAAKAAREDTVVVATGRSDYPNQVNNVLCFPFVFRGALDARATDITEGMKIAAAEALARLAREDVPDAVRRAYGDQPLEFGPEYLIPKPLDERVLLRVAPAVARAAVADGVARRDLDPEAYVAALEDRLGGSREAMRAVLTAARRDPQRLVLAEGTDETVVRAASQLADRGIAEPVLVGDRERVETACASLGFGAGFAPEVVDPAETDLDPYVELLYERRNRKGITRREASALLTEGDYLASALVAAGDADAMLTGRTHHYPSALRPPLEVVGTAPGVEHAAGVYLLSFEDRVVFCADTTVTVDPGPEALAEVTRQTAALARRFTVEPRAALLSYSEFGSVDNQRTRAPREAAERLRDDPAVDFPVDGEMQADTAVLAERLRTDYAFAELDAPANVLVFPTLDAGNIAYKLLSRLGGAAAVGPMLVGMAEPVHVLQRGDSVADIVNLAGVAVAEAAADD